MPEAVWLKLCGHGWRVQHGIVTFFGFGRRRMLGSCSKTMWMARSRTSGEVCWSSCSYRLHFLASWSLRQTRCGSLAPSADRLRSYSLCLLYT
ncbi:hypothetical protein F9K77_04835 [Ochrobactrum sp. LMG 5442]|nr:hypothetical protein F9K77_04835 [Ochrobactrum sp. LMG 5442]